MHTLVEPVSAKLIKYELDNCGITHVVGVPDSCQIHLLDIVQDKYISASSEDQAVGIAAGLRIAGQFPVVSMQNSGLYRSLNSIRGVMMDMAIPGIFLFGLYRRNINQQLADHESLAIKNFLPTLMQWRIRYLMINHSNDVSLISNMTKIAERNRCITAIVFGTNLSV